MDQLVIDKIELIEKEKQLIKRAVNVGICPKCGSELKKYRIDQIHEWTDIIECSENPNHYKSEKYDCWDDDGD